MKKVNGPLNLTFRCRLDVMRRADETEHSEEVFLVLTCPFKVFVAASALVVLGLASARAAGPENFQPHHQAFNYFAAYAPGTKARAGHLKDEAGLMAAIMASPNWPSTAIILTADENGGTWDHPHALRYDFDPAYT